MIKFITCDNIVPLPGSDLFLANLSVANNLKRFLIIYNLAENTVEKSISPSANLDLNNKTIKSLGWINKELLFVTQNRNIISYGWVPNNDPQSIIRILVKSSELPHAPENLIYLDNEHFIALADVGGTTLSLYLYNQENQASSKKFETNGEWVKQLKKLDGNSFAAFCKSGKVLIYTLSKSLGN